MLCGGGLGNAVLFSIGKKARELGNRVLYFAGYKKAEDFYKREELEAAADVLVLSVDRGEAIPARRPSDRSFVGNIVEAMAAYATGRLGPAAIPLSPGRPADRDRLGPHDGGRRPRPEDGPRAAPRSRTTSASRRSTRRCSA